jgi:hypothetical protein
MLVYLGNKKYINTSLKTNLKLSICKTVYSLIFGVFFKKHCI